MKNEAKQLMVTIRKKQVKDKVTHSELQSQLHDLMRRLPQAMIYDVGIHGNCKYFQLHLHAIIFSDKFIPWGKQFSQGPFYIHIGPIREALYKCVSYLHKDDHNNMYKLEQLLIENDYRYTKGGSTF